MDPVQHIRPDAIWLATATEAEAAPLRRRLDVHIIDTGGTLAASRDGRIALLRTGCGPAAVTRTVASLGADLQVERIVACGLAGALAPHLHLGDLVIAEQVHTMEGERIPLDLALARAAEERLTAAGLPCHRGTIFTPPGILTEPAGKRAWHRLTGALAVDTESGAWARLGRERGWPLLILRSILDTATELLPRWIETLVTPEGRIAWPKVAKLLRRHPTALMSLVRMSRQRRRAIRPLAEAVVGMALTAAPPLTRERVQIP
ncbi:MAG: hypothetical protein ACE5HK_00925 [Candidatus Methylomirabilales bacterium]